MIAHSFCITCYVIDCHEINWDSVRRNSKSKLMLVYDNFLVTTFMAKRYRPVYGATLWNRKKITMCDILKLECGTWYHHPRRQQCVLSRNLRNFKVVAWHHDAVTISKIIVFEIICCVAYYSAARFTFPIEQPSNMAAKCGIRRSWKLKVKPNLGCCCNIVITISYISAFVSSW